VYFEAMENTPVARDYATRARDLFFNHKRLITTLISGLVGLTAQSILFELLFQVFHLTSASTAVVLGAEVGLLSNFYLNNKFSFGDRSSDKSLGARLTQFHLVVSGSVIIQWMIVFMTEHMTHNIYLLHVAFLTAVIIGFFWNYTLYKLVVWRRIN
jgi:putative flippase GtrA